MGTFSWEQGKPRAQHRKNGKEKKEMFGLIWWMMNGVIYGMKKAGDCNQEHSWTQ